MSISVGVEGILSDKRWLILPALFFTSAPGEHAHNLFLQTWYELGLIGAILLALAGAAIALRMRRLPKDIQPFAAASFAAFFEIAAFAWSIWQTWFMCAIGLLIPYVSLAAERRARMQAGSQPPRIRLRRAEGVRCN